MYLYKYSVVRFFPSPARGECVNLGLVIGSDQAGDWVFEIERSRSRANLLDDERVFPAVAAELETISAHVQRCQSELLLPNVDDAPSEQWLEHLAANSTNLLQYSSPLPIVAESAREAYEKLWDTFIAEPTKYPRAANSKQTLTTRYWSAMQSAVGANYVKRYFTLDAQKKHASIDVSLHNGVVKELTQCWSFQIKDKQALITDIKSWAFTIAQLRETGGRLHDKSYSMVLDVPPDVNVSVVYAPDDHPDEFTEEAFDVFSDDQVRATCVDLSHVSDHVAVASQLITHD